MIIERERTKRWMKHRLVLTEKIHGLTNRIKMVDPTTSIDLLVKGVRGLVPEWGYAVFCHPGDSDGRHFKARHDCHFAITAADGLRYRIWMVSISLIA